MYLDQEFQVKNPRHKCQPRVEAQMEDSRTSTSYKRLDSTIDILIECPEAEITAIIAVRPKPFPTGSNRDIPGSVQQLVYGGKVAGVVTSAQSLDRHNELLSSIEQVLWPRKDR
ncbi:hypothetical protein O181_091264 [Austropuccinia psidii MF-1]|uniref:Uncharacterized protein n=1 Tax=Austropuccinia psidii MF-1 TaxID=1389203 RepID=A0A9Q3IX11_9BASI|nr:hypothetical protein [Austropuccinia psidii MF-1]